MATSKETICVFVVAMAAGAVLLHAQTPSSEQGQNLLQAGRLSEARDVFEAVLSRDAADAAAQAGEVEVSEKLALQAASKGDGEQALKALLHARDTVPQNARLLYDLGVLEDQMGLFRDADEALGKAAALDGANPNVLYAVARVKMDLGQLAAAESSMQAYLKLKPDDASAHFGLGRIYQIGLQLDKAKEEFARSIQLQPVQTEAYYELGDIALKQADAAGALAQFEKTLARDPRHGGALEGAGEANFKLKRYEEARGFLERAVAVAPDYSPSHYYLGLTLGRLGQKEESQRELKTAAELSEKQNASGGMRLQKQPE